MIVIGWEKTCALIENTINKKFESSPKCKIFLVFKLSGGLLGLNKQNDKMHCHPVISSFSSALNNMVKPRAYQNRGDISVKIITYMEGVDSVIINHTWLKYMPQLWKLQYNELYLNKPVDIYL